MIYSGRKKKLKNQKNNLDERQELTLLRIERNGYWIAFWGLIVSIAVQLFIDSSDYRHVSAELILLTVLSFYIVIASLKNGIWDRRLKPNFLTNFIVSLIAAVVSGIVCFISIYIRYPKLATAAAGGVILAASVFVLCFAALLISAGIYKKRKKKLEQELDDTDIAAE